MVVSLLIALKKSCPWLWRMVEWGNALLFSLRHSGMERSARRVLLGCGHGGFSYSLVEGDDLDALEAFLRRQSASTLEYFHPHDFDRTTLERLFRNRAFLMMKVEREADGLMVGYFFLRCFFIGRAFHGLLVDPVAAGRGIGTTMWAVATKICHAERLRMFATISANNAPSLHSCGRGTDMRTVERLADDYLLVECRRKDD